MTPDVPGQLLGIRRILAEVISPQVTDPYAASVLHESLATLAVLAAAYEDAGPFLRWDAAEASEILRRIGIAVAQFPPEAGGFDVLEGYHRTVRAQLELSIPDIRSDVEASEALVAYFRTRATRFPFTSAN
jgi:hypothetical protein